MSGVRTSSAYITHCILLHRVARQAHRMTTPKSRKSSADSNKAMKILATDIYRTVDYFINKYGSMGALLVMFPAQIALLALDPSADKAIWLRNVLRKISENGGLAIGREILESRCTDLAVTE